jgi:formyl-CoA transferase
MEEVSKGGPLAGLRVLEMGQLIAGPFCSRILADFGAEVIKVELPGQGDALRVWRTMLEETNTSLWWYVQSRNKKSITLDLNHPQAGKVVRQLVKHVDILVENFKPGTMEKWGLGWEELHRLNPKLIMTRVSGWGQTGPYRDKASYGSIGESMGGLRYITGFPDRPPVRPSISLGDSLAGMWGAIGTLSAVVNRQTENGEGQLVDVALNEAVFAMLESMLTEYDKLGIIRERAGTAMPGIAPVNTYQCKDGTYAIIAGNGDSVFKRLVQAIGRPEWAKDSRFANNAGRVKHNDIVDIAIAEWAAQHSFEEVSQILGAVDVPVGPIYTIADIAADPQYQARDMILECSTPETGPLKVPGIVPKLSATPGAVNWLGPKLGEHNREIYGDWLGISEQQLEEWAASGLI